MLSSAFLKDVYEFTTYILQFTKTAYILYLYKNVSARICPTISYYILSPTTLDTQ